MTRTKKTNKTDRNKSDHITKRWRCVIQNVWPRIQCTNLDIKRETIHQEGRVWQWRLKLHSQHPHPNIKARHSYDFWKGFVSDLQVITIIILVH